MKITKLMLSAFVAAAALVSCNKENHSPEIDNDLKTINLSIGNMIMTKGLAGDKINPGDVVQVNDFQVFLTEASGTHLYNDDVMTLNGDSFVPATFYWDGNQLKDATLFTYDYHFVSPHCTRVIAVANAGKPLTLAQALELSAEAAQQQDASNLILFGEDVLEPKLVNGEPQIHQGTDNAGKTFYSEVYSASPILTPTIARFEVDGFSMNFNAGELVKVDIKDILFQNYHNNMTYAVPGTAKTTHIANLEADADVYYWFTSHTDDNTAATWYRDSFTGLVLQKPASPTEGTNYVHRVDIKDGATKSPRAYHLFAPASCPDLVVNMVVTTKDPVSGAEHTTNAYVHTATFRTSDGTAITQIQPGTIYRMSGRGETDGDGTIDINEDDLNSVDRCLDIIVSVKSWDVVLVTPEF